MALFSVSLHQATFCQTTVHRLRNGEVIDVGSVHYWSQYALAEKLVADHIALCTSSY